ncbi:FKBP-type peptidyl-prolyl cis-trans isomerase [Roseateles sp.]|uniref:FKBP-type peptidyl-prolyl cis-trans isomerase n=1 Tax=Roseateles sp. TaxID=1971397 RepID=UPI00286D18A0|nr:FKBP-type peptidyl-prolyl cis-trans isomerase [Roseateles sp.]
MFIKNFFSISAVVLALSAGLGLSACGGGGDSGTSNFTDTSGSAAVTELKIVDTLVGTGAVAATGTSATVQYTGWLYDVKATGTRGAQFDSSVGKMPLNFKVGSADVIKGFDQGVKDMKVGGKRTLTIPSSLAYGTTGAGTIPANAALVFDVELLSVK